MDDLPKINSWADVQAQTLTKAEKQLIAAARDGRMAKFGDTVPTEPTDDVLIRAPLLRYLILGGCAECRTPAKGVTVFGAWIAQQLDLEYETAAGAIMLTDCHIAEQPYLLQLQAAGLILSGSKLPKGLTAQGAIITGDLFLRSIHAQSEVNIAGAQITGQLGFVGAKLENADGDALNAQGVKVGEDVFLGNVTAKGRVTLSGAQITGQLSCKGATLENAGGYALNAQRVKVGQSVFLGGATTKGCVTLSGAEITGQLDFEGATLENAKGIALDLQGASVQGGFLWRGIKKVKGFVDLNTAHVKDITDDAASWEKCANINLVGLTYDQLHGTPDLPARLAWLEKGAKWGGQFHPQPYEQLAKVWRANGYRRDSAVISYHKEIEKGAAQRQQERKNKQWLRPIFGAISDRAFRWFYGYGYKPKRSAYLLCAAFAIATLIAGMAWRTGDFAPNSDIILVTEDWQTLATDTAQGRNAAAEWSAKAAKGQDYATFVSFYYAADVLIPIIDLGQTNAWAPSTNRGIWGRVLFWLNPLFVALGWFVTASWAAAIAGIIRRE